MESSKEHGEMSVREEGWGSKTVGDQTKDRDIETQKILKYIHLSLLYIEEQRPKKVNRITNTLR